ncbi:hypothetical protein QYM36_005567 [Artemia franciscana]|uniref:Uncharacterized protein n=1 Tax=Artemia franciscana TaxID=6661 RepID=A0AA88L4A5_ARTSF|nr:hypothetical protein QYM36_008725 [Artemia franciscana]KAK2718303.1 hypothetical protein QYM36_005567 [Artemia franciscana]
MPTIQVTSPLSEYDCEPDLWDVDSDSEKEEKVKDRPVLQSMPTIQVTSPLSEYDCEPDLWDVDSDSEKEPGLGDGVGYANEV